MHYFEERQILYGDLLNPESRLKNVRCEFVSNELDTNAMQATFSAYSGSTLDVVQLFRKPDNLTFESKSGNRLVTLAGYLPTFSVASRNDEFLKFNVGKCMTHAIHSAESISSIYIAFYVPAVKMYERRAVISQHFKKGLLLGWPGWQDPDKSEQSRWDVEEYNLPSDIGTMSISPSVLFKDVKIDGKESTIVVDQMLVEWNTANGELSLDESWTRITGLVEDYLYILSFLERDFVNWTFARMRTVDAEGRTVDVREFMQRTSSRKNVPQFSNRHQSYRLALQKLHIDLVKSFRKQPESIRDSLKRILDRYLVASTHDTWDTQLIYWHSCLDIIIKHIAVEGKSFSHKLVAACKKMAVQWLDLYPGITDETLEEKADFGINKLRNDMLHRGIYSEDIQLVADEIRNARALSERLVVRILGLDYEKTGVGLREE